MRRRPDPARLDLARYEGVRSRLIAAGIQPIGIDGWFIVREAAPNEDLPIRARQRQKDVPKP